MFLNDKYGKEEINPLNFDEMLSLRKECNLEYEKY